MPGLTDTDLARKMLKVRKEVPIILFTGYGEGMSPEKPDPRASTSS
jgi:FixJ family two-component response regulator